MKRMFFPTFLKIIILVMLPTSKVLAGPDGMGLPVETVDFQNGFPVVHATLADKSSGEQVDTEIITASLESRQQIKQFSEWAFRQAYQAHTQSQNPYLISQVLVLSQPSAPADTDGRDLAQEISSTLKAKLETAIDPLAPQVQSLRYRLTVSLVKTIVSGVTLFTSFQVTSQMTLWEAIPVSAVLALVSGTYTFKNVAFQNWINADTIQHKFKFAKASYQKAFSHLERTLRWHISDIFYWTLAKATMKIFATVPESTLSGAAWDIWSTAFTSTFTTAPIGLTISSITRRLKENDPERAKQIQTRSDLISLGISAFTSGLIMSRFLGWQYGATGLWITFGAGVASYTWTALKFDKMFPKTSASKDTAPSPPSCSSGLGSQRLH